MGKIVTVNLPDIGEGVVEGEVIEWLKKLNEPVKQDEPVVIVMTDKATVELPAPCPGTLVKQHFREGEIAIRDKPLYEIETSEDVEVKQVQSEKAPEKMEEKSKKPAPIKSEEHFKRGSKALAAPPTRKLAKELKIDINQIDGSGENGIVTQDDITKYCAQNHEVESQTAITRLPDSEEKPLLGIRNLMAQRMSESKKNIPHFSYFEQVDATRLVQLRQSFKEEASKQDTTVTFMPFILKALSICLKRYPIVNSSLDTSKNVIVVHHQHNIGLAITTKQGLIVPVLKGIQAMTLQELILAYEELKHRALSNKLLPSDMKEATITVSNFGVLGGGGLWATPIINYPEAAILAISRIQKLPLVRNGSIVARDTLNLSWSFDHRIIDGDLAASFSHYMSTLLQNPAPLL
jgi:pyruvate dehydrogenase E2 component (dihydrolipoamide acetyltransferase)